MEEKKFVNEGMNNTAKSGGGGLGPQKVSANVLLGEALQCFLERSNSQATKPILEKLTSVMTQLTKTEAQQNQSNVRLSLIEKSLNNLSSHSKLLENASQANMVLSDQHYEHCIIEPMVRSLFAVIDLIEDVRKTRPEGDQAEVLDAIKAMLLQFLENYGIEIVRHKPSSPFDPQVMKPVSKIPTSNKKLDGYMAESLLVGFRLNHQRMLRPENVSLYEFEE